MMVRLRNGVDRQFWRGHHAALASTIAVALLLIGATVTVRRSSPDGPIAVARVQQFSETMIESGTLVAQKMMLYASTIPAASAKILEIAPEGQAVQTGDLIIRFDASQFERAREHERAALAEAQAELTRAEENAHLEALGGQADLEAANQGIANAERGLANELRGKGQVALVEAEAAHAEAVRELTRARTDVDDLRPLLEEKFITRAEFQRAEQALTRAEDQARLAASRRESLVQYERPAAASRAQSELTAARQALSRQGEAFSARTAQRRAAIAVARSHVAQVASRIALLTDQIDRATIRAQGPGLVVYRDLYFGSEQRKPQVGDEVFPNQPIIALPDSSLLVVETRIREIDLHRVSIGQKVQVRVDAYPDLRLSAVVTSIGALAQEDVTRAGAKFFPLTVRLTTSDSRLRTGMTARVEIEVAALSSAVVVPIAAVFDDHGQPYVVVASTIGGPERRPVTLAGENDSLAAIGKGVQGGDRVLLVDPTARPVP